MTVDNTPVAVVYTVTSTGSDQEFTITFPYISKSFVKAYSVTDKVETKLVYNTDYTINGQTLTVTKVLSADDKLVIFRVTDITQEILWVDGQAVHTPDIMQADDKITHILQELSEQVDRSVKITKEEAAAGTNPEYRWEEIEAAREQVLAAQDATEQAKTDAEQARDDTFEARDTALDVISGAKEEALDTIDTSKQEAIESIESSTTTAQQTILQDTTAALEAIGNAEAGGLEAIETAKNNAVDVVQTEGAVQVEAAKNEADRAKAEADKAAEIVGIGPATKDKLGLVKIGDGISVDANGVISADIPDIDVATKDKPGIVQVGNNLSVDENGVLSADAQEINIGPDMIKDETNTISDKREVLYFEKLPEGGLPTEGVKNGALAIIDDGRQTATLDSIVDEVTKRMSVAQIGEIKWFAHGETVDEGWLLCDWPLLSKNTFAALYAKLGDTWGRLDDDPADMFRGPNLVGRWPKGVSPEDVGKLLEAGLPNIEGEIQAGDTYNASALFINGTGALTSGQLTNSMFANGNNGPATNYWSFKLDASKSNEIYGASETVQPPSACLVPYVRAFNSISGADNVSMQNVMQELVTIRNALVPNLEDERVVGRIGDKDVYERVFIGITPSSEGPIHSGTIENIDLVVKVSGVCTATNNVALENYTYFSDFMFFSFSKELKQLCFSTNTVLFFNVPFVVTFRYTKTTD